MSTVNDLAIILVSDIHLTSPPETNWWHSKKRLFIDTACRLAANSQHVLIVLSGDITQSGRQDEFAVAQDLLLDLQIEIENRCAPDSISFVTAPGNHDNDLSSPRDHRTYLLNLQDNELTDQLLDDITRVQDNYFDFAGQIESIDEPIHGWHRLHRTRSLSINGRVVKINILNTAWTCTRHDEYGKMRFPSTLHLDDDGDYVITILHHPISWLREEDGVRLREEVCRHSDLVITGHVHHSIISSSSSPTLGTCRLLEAGAMQERDTVDSSEFRVVTLNFFETNEVTHRCSLDSGAYALLEESNTSIAKNHLRSSNAFEPTQEFLALLDDPGVGVKHPRAKTLRLNDFFVMPTLLRPSGDQKEKRLTKGPEVLNTLTGKRSLVLGPESSGKSSLARSLCASFLRSGMVPCLATGDAISPIDARKSTLFFENLIHSHYGQNAKQTFFQLDRLKRVFIIDDMHLSKLNSTALSLLLNAAHATFSTIVIISSSSHALHDLLTPDGEAAPLLQLEQFHIVELGYKQRLELIRRWKSIGLSGYGHEGQLDRDCEALAGYLSDAVKRSYIPSYPYYVLLMLQASDANQRLDASIGAYGQLYQKVIFEHLRTDNPVIDTETQTNFLAGLAGLIWKSKTHGVALAEAKAWYATYQERYAIRTHWDAIWKTCELSRLVKLDADSLVFRYPFAFSYFLAIHISQHLKDSERSDAVRNLVETIFLDESAATIICLIQLTKDKAIIQAILARAAIVFGDEMPVDLVEDTKFVNSTLVELPRRSLPEDRKAVSESLYQDDSNDDAYGDETANIAAPSEELSEIMLQFSSGYRLVQAIGQILRAFSGSLEAEQKSALCRACFDIGLRTLKYYLKIAQSESIDLADKIAAQLKRDHPRIDRESAYSEAGRRLCFILENFAISVIKQLSRAVGTSPMSMTIEKCLEDGKSSSDYLSLAIQLDHYKDFPKTLVEKIKDGGGSKFASLIVKDLVWYHLHVVDRDRELRQKMCQMLGIELIPKLLYNKDIKRLPGRIS